MKTYYEKKSIGSQDGTPYSILLLDHEDGRGVEYNLAEVSIRGHNKGDILNNWREITGTEFHKWKREFDERLADQVAVIEDIFDEVMEDIEKEEKFIPKTKFSVMHKDLQVGGYSTKETLELTQFLLQAKDNNHHLLVCDAHGEIIAMIDCKTLRESSFEFEKI